MGNVDHPKHYNAGKKNVDNEIEDLDKAVWYIKRYIEKKKENK